MSELLYNLSDDKRSKGIWKTFLLWRRIYFQSSLEIFKLWKNVAWSWVVNQKSKGDIFMQYWKYPKYKSFKITTILFLKSYSSEKEWRKKLCELRTYKDYTVYKYNSKKMGWSTAEKYRISNRGEQPCIATGTRTKNAISESATPYKEIETPTLRLGATDNLVERSVRFYHRGK